MRKLLALSLVTAAAFSAPAFASDRFDTPDKRWAVVGSFSHLEPKSNSGDDIGKVKGGNAAAVSANWYATDNIAVELWGSLDKYDHTVRDSDGYKLGDIKQRPVALSAQYHFGESNSTFRPFVGLGYYQSSFSNLSGNSQARVEGPISLKKAKGAIGTVGVDMNINPTWFVRADARYMHSRPDVTFAGHRTGSDVKLDPLVIGLGIGARF